MITVDANSVRFVKINLRDYCIFKGSHEIEFKRHQTLIVGKGGTGKTIIVDALKHLGPASGVKPHFLADSPDMSVEVVTSGNKKLIKEYPSIIFLDSEHMVIDNQDAIFEGIASNRQITEIKDETRLIFQSLLSKKRLKINIQRDLNPALMASGEKICFRYSLVFAVRKILNLDLPIVFDSPYGRLDMGLRTGVRAFLEKHPCQQIMLGVQSEFGKDDKPDYVLRFEKDSSQIIRCEVQNK